jgi:hypothetical protein
MKKHRRKHGDRYSRVEDWLFEAGMEWEEMGYARLPQVCMPWRKRWLDDHDYGRRSRDNEGWDDDMVNEKKMARFRQGTRAHRRFRPGKDDLFEF